MLTGHRVKRAVNMADKIAHLLETIDRGVAGAADKSDAPDKEQNPLMIGHLLLMRDYGTDADRSHEMWEGIRTMEAFRDGLF
jgi:hypothetical protein